MAGRRAKRSSWRSRTFDFSRFYFFHRLELIVEQALSRTNLSSLDKHFAQYKRGKSGIADTCGHQELINEIVNVFDRKVSIEVSHLELAVVRVQRLKALVNFFASTNEAQVEDTEETNVAKISLVNERLYDVHIRLNHEHLE